RGRRPTTPAFSAFYGQSWQRFATTPIVSKSHSLPAARDPTPGSPSPRRPDLGQNSRLSLCLTPPGVTAGASAYTAHNPLGFRAVGTKSRQFTPWRTLQRQSLGKDGRLSSWIPANFVAASQSRSNTLSLTRSKPWARMDWLRAVNGER